MIYDPPFAWPSPTNHYCPYCNPIPRCPCCGRPLYPVWGSPIWFSHGSVGTAGPVYMNETCSCNSPPDNEPKHT